MRRFPVVLVLLALTLGAGVARAQSASKISLQGSALYVGVFGSAFDGVQDGVGFEAQARYNPSAFSIGAGYQASIHSMDFGGSSETLSFAGPFLEPRYVIDIGSPRAAPYVSGRVAFLKQTADVQLSGVGVHLSSSGTQLNLGGGVLVRLSPTVNLDLGATFGRIHFAEVKADVPGYGTQVFDTGSYGDGQNLVVRAGVAVGVGH
jgi:hypothetical protein